MEIKEVVVGIVQRGEEYLVGRRASHQTLAGYAEFPGGKLLEGEAPEAGVCREILEETGLTVEVTDWRREVKHAYTHGELHITFFICRPLAEVKPQAPFRWVPREELGRLKFPAANQAIFAELFPEIELRK